MANAIDSTPLVQNMLVFFYEEIDQTRKIVNSRFKYMQI